MILTESVIIVTVKSSMFTQKHKYRFMRSLELKSRRRRFVAVVASSELSKSAKSSAMTSKVKSSWKSSCKLQTSLSDSHSRLRQAGWPCNNPHLRRFQCENSPQATLVIPGEKKRGFYCNNDVLYLHYFDDWEYPKGLRLRNCCHSAGIDWDYLLDQLLNLR